MRAAVFHKVGQPLRIESVDDPTPGDNQVVLRVGHCGICGSDLHATSGHGYTFDSGTVPGHEYAGEVVAPGKDVDNLKIGDCVTALPLNGSGKCGNCLSDAAADPRAMFTKSVSLDELPETFEALRTPSEICKVTVNPW